VARETAAGIGTDADRDALASQIAPAGWYCVGTIVCSRQGATCAPTWTGWYVRVTYWPEAWRSKTTLLAPPAVYAAAQIAGLETRLDGCLSADHSGIQYYTPAMVPIVRQCFWEGVETLPERVVKALDRIREIDRRRSVGYMWARPDTEGRREACAIVVEWVRAHHAHILPE